MEVIEKYFDILKEIKNSEERYDLGLSENLIVAILQEVGKDLRTGEIDKSKKENIKEMRGNSNKPSEKQIAILKRMRVPNIESLSKSEATAIIKESIERSKKKKGVEY